MAHTVAGLDLRQDGCGTTLGLLGLLGLLFVHRYDGQRAVDSTEISKKREKKKYFGLGKLFFKRSAPQLSRIVERLTLIARTSTVGKVMKSAFLFMVLLGRFDPYNLEPSWPGANGWSISVDLDGTVRPRHFTSGP